MSQDHHQAAVLFGRNWIAANVFPGPHSRTDQLIGQVIVDQFVREAEEAGLTAGQLEQSLGDIGVYLQNAFCDARHSRGQDTAP